MNITLLRYFVAVAEDLHFARAAEQLNISRAKLSSSVEKLETELGEALFNRNAETTTLTKAGNALLKAARIELAEAPEPEKPKQNAGGKAKASKGKGRAPAVKGAPRPKKQRQGR